MTIPLIDIRHLYREFPAGDDVITVLKDINIQIMPGEMVAIMGASGSGKSTLMNILGCLDRPTRGEYLVSGQETGKLDADALAKLRREHFGFIFQRYQLLPDLTAVGNVETPAIYAGKGKEERRTRARALLSRLGLSDRLGHKPSQLSGGQQQRVSVARALMNGGQVILADEPTGALDTKSGQEMLKIIDELHAEGHTIIIVTHDIGVAERAERIIEIKDGEVIADRRKPDKKPQNKYTPPPHNKRNVVRESIELFKEAFAMAMLAMWAHKLRTFLTMLGIIIGIASVVSVIALGAGSQQKILADISSMGTNTIDIYPGTDFGDRKSQRIHTLVPADADLLALQPYVDSVTPTVSTSVDLRYRNLSVTASVSGVGDQFFRVRGYEMAQGKAFDRQGVDRLAQEAVIDDNTFKKLFTANDTPLGKVILLGDVPVRIIGVTKPKQNNFGSNDTLNIWVPYTTAMARLLGQQHLKSITVRVSDAATTAAAEKSIVSLLTQRHGVKDFFVNNLDTIKQTIEKTTETMTLLVSAIALISLIVGGIGVMNIMLVSVTERTKEIGVRMAVGARRGDVMQQFLIEAVLVCLIGGFLGVMMALGIGVVFSSFVSSFKMIYSASSMVAAFVCSTLIGVTFGFLPARSASRLDPVEALARE